MAAVRVKEGVVVDDHVPQLFGPRNSILARQQQRLIEQSKLQDSGANRRGPEPEDGEASTWELEFSYGILLSGDYPVLQLCRELMWELQKRETQVRDVVTHLDASYAKESDLISQAEFLSFTTAGDIVQRIAKSAYKAASEPSLLLLTWDQACVEVVSRMMQGYSFSCSDAPWFFCIDLPPVLCAACWEVLRAEQQHWRILRGCIGN